jgi:hypothetical protein
VITVECQQGTPEWLAARAGVLTASDFSIARSRAKDGVSMTDGARYLAFRKAIERISGVPQDAEMYETWQMRRGQRLEDDARLLHSAEIGRAVKPVGIILTDDRKFGASADGWINDPVLGKGGAEYKCLVGAKELMAVYIENDPSKYMDQVQGNLWLAGRAWWDFCVYCPALEKIGLHFWRLRVKRDEDYIERLEADLIEFDRLIESYRWRLLCLQARRAGKPDPAPPDGIDTDLDCPFEVA